MAIDPIVPLVSGLFGLAGVGLSVWANLRIKRIGDRSARELEEYRTESTQALEEYRSESASSLATLQRDLNEEKDIRAEHRSKEAKAQELVSRYREPLLTAAFELQSKLYNSVGQHFLRTYWTTSREYARDHTLYVLAQYLGWREIVRYEVQFLDLGDAPATIELGELLEEITHSLSTDRLPPSFRVFRGEQRAIGEKMMVAAAASSDGSPHQQCIGYAAFVEALKKPDFRAWFDQLKNDVQDVATAEQPDYQRLSLLQNALMDLIERLDQEHLRFPIHLRKRLTLTKELVAIKDRRASVDTAPPNPAVIPGDDIGAGE